MLKSTHENYIIIAETAFSHEGDVGYLMRQTDVAVDGGADCIKFQVFLEKESYFVPQHPSLEAISIMILSRHEWERVFNYAFNKRIRIVALPLNVESFTFCRHFEEIIYAYEIHSVCLNDKPLLDAMQGSPRNIILGVGGRLPQDIAYALESLQKRENEVVLMCGFQSFPTDAWKLELEKIRSFKDMFKCEMGYADHSSFVDKKFSVLNNYAYILGARCFEKHVVVDPGVERVDFESAVGADLLRTMRTELENVKMILGDGDVFRLNDAEVVYRNRGKHICARRDLNAGHTLSIEDIGFFVTKEGSDFDPIMYCHLVGKRLVHDMKKGEPFRFGGME